MAHKVYKAIVQAVKKGDLREPFTIKGFKESCPELGEGTYKAFLYKHREGNPGNNSELFIMVSPGSFKCIRPFRYGL